MAMYVRTYESLDAMVKAADEAWQAGRRHPLHLEDRWTGRPEIKSWEDAKRVIASHWQDGFDDVEDMLREIGENIGVTPVNRKRRGVWSQDNGDDVCVDRLRAGQDYWRRMERQVVPGTQTLSVVTSATTSAGVNHRDILWRGAAGIVLCDLLERAGFRVELWASQFCNPAYDNGGGMFQAVCLKRADQPLDMATVVNGVSGWMYRTVFFQSYYVETESTPDAGLGVPRSLREDMEQVRDLCGQNDVVVIDGLWSKEAAVAKVREVLARYSRAAA